MKIINRFNILILIISTILLFLALLITGNLGLYDGYFYRFTIPFILTVSLSLVLSISYLKFRKGLIYIINLIVFSLLFIPAIYAITRWPGGDDGSGLFWLFTVVYSSILVFAIGLVLTTITLKLYIKGEFSITKPNMQ